MSLKWVRGISPYVFNDFGKLQIGPDAEPQAFQARAEKLVQKIAAGERVELAGQALDDHAINEAATKLLDPASRAGELLLVHRPRQAERGNLKALIDNLNKAATLSLEHRMPELVQPNAVFWFIPDPGPELVELPEFGALCLLSADDEEDQMLDIVFDE